MSTNADELKTTPVELNMGELIRFGLLRRKRKHNELAALLGISCARMSEILAGKIQLRADEIIPVADFIGVDPQELLRLA